MNYFLYIVACFLQPICWPLPEMATIILGAESFGSVQAFIIGYIFILLGIAFLYKFTFKLSEKYLKKFQKGKKFKRFQNFVKKNEILTTGILFVLPILPDEVICISSAIIGIKFKMFFTVAIFAKFISIGMYAFSSEVSLYFGINQLVIILIEVVIIFLCSFIYNKKYENQKNS